MYIQLEQALFDKDADSFTCRVAKTPDEIKGLIESGFEYVTERRIDLLSQTQIAKNIKFCKFID
jgi:NAD/NADP transhydrogenase alpha subunit